MIDSISDFFNFFNLFFGLILFFVFLINKGFSNTKSIHRLPPVQLKGSDGSGENFENVCFIKKNGKLEKF